MASSCFIGTASSELSGEIKEQIFKDYLNHYRSIRKQAGEPSYIIGIDWEHPRTGRIPVVIGDWNK